jgi:hypothetical protein
VNLPGPVADIGNSSVAAAVARQDSGTGETLICGVDQHHRYPMVSTRCRLVDLRVNVEGAAELGEH